MRPAATSSGACCAIPSTCSATCATAIRFRRSRPPRRGGAHLARGRAAASRRTAGCEPPITVIPNGVDTERFHPPTADERAAARARARRARRTDALPLFVGHEFERKGDPARNRGARPRAPGSALLVVGGSADDDPEATAVGRAPRRGRPGRVRRHRSRPGAVLPCGRHVRAAQRIRGERARRARGARLRASGHRDPGRLRTRHRGRRRERLPRRPGCRRRSALGCRALAARTGRVARARAAHAARSTRGRRSPPATSNCSSHSEGTSHPAARGAPDDRSTAHPPRDPLRRLLRRRAVRAATGAPAGATTGTRSR